jgi:2-keto-4-pentenoate hydratase
VNVETCVDLMWRCVSEGIDYPAELRGKLSFDDAYLIQLGLLARYEQAGDEQVGWKVGLTAKAMQAQIGIPEPVFPRLLQQRCPPARGMLQPAVPAASGRRGVTARGGKKGV